MKKSQDGWKEVKLSDILESIENGNRPKGGITDLKDGIPSFGGEHINSKGGFNLKNVRLIPKDFYNSMKRGKIKKGDVLVVKDGATTGKVSFVDDDFPFESAAVNEHVFILRGKKDLVYQKFLFYHLYSPIGQRQMDANFHGAAIGGINTQFIKNYNLILPPLLTQKKIAAVLEKAEKLREWRKEADGLTDKLLRSTFLEMFGDIFTNSKGWKVEKLGNLIKKNSFISYGIVQPGNEYSEGVNIIRPIDIINNQLIYENIKKVDPEIERKFKRTRLEGNEILITVRGTTGNTAITNEKCKGFNVTRGIAVIRPDLSNINIFYLNEYFKSPVGYRYIQEHTQGATLRQINIKDLKVMPILLPPIELQQKFASIVETGGVLQEYQTQSRQHIENFFNVLMQRAFHGELEAK